MEMERKRLNAKISLVNGAKEHAEKIFQRLFLSNRNLTLSVEEFPKIAFTRAIMSNGALAGFVGIRKCKENIYEVCSLYVYNKYRKMCIASKLLSYATKKLSGLIIATTMPFNKGSIKTFENNDFVKVNVNGKVLLLRWVV